MAEAERKRPSLRSMEGYGWLLDTARCIYTLRHHDIIAKTRAGLWALKEHMPPYFPRLRGISQLDNLFQSS